jgi:TldD protein
LGYEANASGTSFLDDPLAMLGKFQVTAPGVTVTANRAAPTELATVQWDAEGVVPNDATLIKDGVLVDFQTTREQAAWLAPYYQRTQRPVHSHGYAAAPDAHALPLQHPPNFALAPSATTVTVADLIANVTEGIFIERGEVWQSDAQARTGLLSGQMRQIRQGRLGALLEGGVLLFDTLHFWKNVTAIGGPTAQGSYSASAILGDVATKGEPAQAVASHTARAAAATILNQAIINPKKKA